MSRTFLASLALAGLLAAPFAFADTCPAAKSVAPPGDVVAVAAQAGSFSTLVNALVATGLDKAVRAAGPVTVFAPTDAAFAKLTEGTVKKLLAPEGREALAKILTYHVVAGRKTATDAGHSGLKTLNGASVAFRKTHAGKLVVGKLVPVKATVEVGGSVVYVIDEVLMPPEADVSPARKAVREAGTFKTLLAALEAAGLDKAVLDGDTPLTVFAPTDAAFAKLPKGTVEKLVMPANRKALADILKYHVVRGSVSAKQAIAAGEAATLQGGKVLIGIHSDGRLVVNKSGVTKADLTAGNLTIHVIDGVLLPH